MQNLSLAALIPAKIYPVLATVLVLIAVDTALGIIAAIKAGTLDARQLPRFLETSILQLATPLLVLALASGQPAVQDLFFAAAAAVTAKLLADIKDKATALLGLARSAAPPAPPQS